MRLWPDVPWHKAVWVEQGWDFLVALVDGWVLRIPRSHGAQWRLARERYLLQKLSNPPVQIPCYQERSTGLWGYPMISGLAMGTLSPGTPLWEETCAFIRWLHRMSETDSDVVRSRWQRRYQSRIRGVLQDVGPLLSVREYRQVEYVFKEADQQLAASRWPVVLLHGDLVAEHLLVDGGHLAGVIDFGDWRFGDPMFDWSGLPVKDYRILGSDRPPGEAARLSGYRLLYGLLSVRHAMAAGNVERAEQGMRSVRRILFAEIG